MTAQYIIGIDLGTTNNVLAYSDLNSESAAIELLEIPQLVAAGTLDKRPSLPSFVYLGTQSESAEGAFNLPWACLLYTSPSPRDLSTSRMPSSA